MPNRSATRDIQRDRHGVFLRLTTDCGLTDVVAQEVSKRLPGWVAKRFCGEFDSEHAVVLRRAMTVKATAQALLPVY